MSLTLRGGSEPVRVRAAVRLGHHADRPEPGGDADHRGGGLPVRPGRPAAGEAIPGTSHLTDASFLNYIT